MKYSLTILRFLFMRRILQSTIGLLLLPADSYETAINCSCLIVPLVADQPGLSLCSLGRRIRKVTSVLFSHSFFTTSLVVSQKPTPHVNTLNNPLPSLYHSSYS